MIEWLYCRGNQAVFHLNLGVMNDKLAPPQALYLREFFSHHFQRRSALETLTTLAGGLSVLQSLVSNFEKSQGYTPSPPSPQPHSSLDKRNSIEIQGAEIHRHLDELYCRLKKIFQQTKLQVRDEDEGEIIVKEGDEQIYEMLHQYRQTCNEQKEMRKKVEEENVSLKKRLQHVEEENARINRKMQEMQAELQRNNRKMAEIQQELTESQLQLETSQNQKETLLEKISQLSQADTLNQNLQAQLNLARMREEAAAAKLEAVDDLIQARIAEKQEEWSALIQQKLSQTSIYEQPICKAFRQFVSLH